MNTADAPESAPSDSDLHTLARDWITLWQSELSALALDREVQETWQRLLGIWAGTAGTLLAAIPRGLDQAFAARAGYSAGRTPPPRSECNADAGAPSASSASSPRPAAAGSASGARDAEIEHLHRRIAELEQRLAAMEREREGERAAHRRRASRRTGPAG